MSESQMPSAVVPAAADPVLVGASGLSTPYCTVKDLVELRGVVATWGLLNVTEQWRIFIDYHLLNPSSPEHQYLVGVGAVVTSEVDEACGMGRVYTPSDLLSLTGNQRERLRVFVADLWYWRCIERWRSQPAEPDRIPGARLALQTLDRLAQGVRVFGEPHAAAKRVGDTVYVRGHSFKLTDMRARVLELALRDGGLTFKEAPQAIPEWKITSPSSFTSFVTKLKDALAAATAEVPFQIDLTTEGRCIRATVVDKT